jgi:excisionase family DNA binding protein
MFKNINVQPGNSSSLKQTYTVQEVAQMLDIPLRSAYHLCSTTTEFKVKRMGRTIRINKASFDEWWAR